MNFDSLYHKILSAPIELAQTTSGTGLEVAAPTAAPMEGITQFGDAGNAVGMAGADVSHNAFTLFLKADIIVQSVMIMLILASVWCWAIIIEKLVKLKRLREQARHFEEAFWSGEAMEDLYAKMKGKPPTCPMSAIFITAMREWNRSVAKKTGTLSAATSERIERGMQTTLNQELNQLERYLTFLASVGSSAPFIGLFGTVWGIMNSFASIAASKQTSLAVVAPGISEALLATALGLVAAIPATIFYNKISSDLGRYAARLEAFSAEMAAIFSRQFDEQ